jgi:hypothetical protein
MRRITRKNLRRMRASMVVKTKRRKMTMTQKMNLTHN